MKLIQIVEGEMKPIVLVLGKLCSGKGTFCGNYTEQGYTHIATSDVVKRVSGFTTREELQSTMSMDSLIVDEMINDITEHTKVVIDGIRQQSIIDGLIYHYGKSKIDIIWLDVSDEIRKSRYANRGDAKDTKPFDSAEAGDVKLGINQVEQFAKQYGKTILN